jgi:DNA-binding NtrC family response regulator
MPGTQPVDAMADHSNADGPEDDAPRPALRGLRCLVLDDELWIALDIEHILETAGAAAVTCVGNLADAMAALQNGSPFAVAVVDIDLNGSDSMALPAALQERGVPFVFLTGMGGDDPRARRYPEVPVVDKPYQADELLAALRRALRKR